jgi:hypothetical protein
LIASQSCWATACEARLKVIAETRAARAKNRLVLFMITSK